MRFIIVRKRRFFPIIKKEEKEVGGLENTNRTKRVEHSIRTRFPKLYSRMIEKLKTYNVHSYDIQINIVEEGQQNELILHYGEGYAHTLSQFFTSDQMEAINPGIMTFLENSVETIK